VLGRCERRQCSPTGRGQTAAPLRVQTVPLDHQQRGPTQAHVGVHPPDQLPPNASNLLFRRSPPRSGRAAAGACEALIGRHKIGDQHGSTPRGEGLEPPRPQRATSSSAKLNRNPARDAASETSGPRSAAPNTRASRTTRGHEIVGPRLRRGRHWCPRALNELIDELRQGSPSTEHEPHVLVRFRD